MQKWPRFPNCFRAFLEVMEIEIVSKTIVQGNKRARYART